MAEQQPVRNRRGQSSTSQPKPEEEQPRDYSVYYTRAAAYFDADTAKFAPPVKLSASTERRRVTKENPPSPSEAAATVYTRKENLQPESPHSGSYQSETVTVSGNVSKRKIVLIAAFLLVAVLGVLLFLFASKKAEKMSGGLLAALPVSETSEPAATEAVVSVSPYSAFEKTVISSAARQSIAQLAPDVRFSSTLVSDECILASSSLNDGGFDHYLFSSDNGRLIAYFDHLREDDAFFLQDGRLYVRQSPYVLCSDGKAVITEEKRISLYGEGSILHPFYNGWAAVETADGEWNFINEAGTPFSTIEYKKVFPFSGDYTLAWVDTGNTAAVEGQYTLYILSSDGNLQRWKSSDQTDEVIFSANDYAVLQNGDVYRLPDISQPAFHSTEIILYPEFNALVLKDTETGKKALYVNGKAYNSYAYDDILPIRSDLTWKKCAYTGNTVSAYVMTLDPKLYDLPDNYTFSLYKDGKTSYISLSRFSHDPLTYQGELPAPMEVVP